MEAEEEAIIESVEEGAGGEDWESSDEEAEVEDPADGEEVDLDDM